MNPLAIFTGLGSKLWAIIAAVGAVLLAVAIFIGKVFGAGKASVAVTVAAQGQKAEGKMVEAAIDAPKTKPDIIAGMKGGKFCIALLALMLPLAGCTTTQYVVKVQCPHIVEYDAAFLDRAADAWKALPDGNPLDRLLTDYRQLRDVIRACNSAT